MKTVELIRSPGNGETTPGSVYVDGTFVCFSVENSEKLYPEGKYEMVLGSTGKTMPDDYKGNAYEVTGVPGRTLIKWHVANYWYQLEGCTAPNMNLYATAKPAINGGSSMLATALFMNAMKDVNGLLVKKAKLTVRGL